MAIGVLFHQPVRCGAWLVQPADDLRKPFQTSPDILVKIELVCSEVCVAKRGDDLCIEPLDPIGSSELPGFSTGYLIGCAVIASILAVELIVAIWLQ